MSKRKSRSPFPILIAAGGLLLLVASILLQTQKNPGAPQVTAPSPGQADTAIPRVSLADAKTAFDSGTAVFLDVRVADAYNSSHVQGAINIPEGELRARLAELNPSDWIIPYCT